MFSWNYLRIILFLWQLYIFCLCLSCCDRFFPLTTCNFFCPWINRVHIKDFKVRREREKENWGSDKKKTTTNWIPTSTPVESWWCRNLRGGGLVALASSYKKKSNTHLEVVKTHDSRAMFLIGLGKVSAKKKNIRKERRVKSTMKQKLGEWQWLFG